jgi:hypothetical protein
MAALWAVAGRRVLGSPQLVAADLRALASLLLTAARLGVAQLAAARRRSRLGALVVAACLWLAALLQRIAAARAPGPRA